MSVRCRLGLHKRANWRKAEFRIRRRVASRWTCSRCGKSGVSVI